MAVQGALWLTKRLSLNFSFLNRISLLLISSSYPIVLAGLGGPRSRPLYFQKIFWGIAGNRTRDLLDGSQTCLPLYQTGDHNNNNNNNNNI